MTYFGKSIRRLGKKIITDRNYLSMIRNTPKSISVNDAILDLFKIDEKSIQQYRLDLFRNKQFWDILDAELIEKRYERPYVEEWHIFLYILIRISKPKIVVETGTFDGISSAIALQAMEDNKVGILRAIDVLALTPISNSIAWPLPEDCSSGWAIPNYLRHRFEIILGDAKKYLPDLLTDLSKIDIFLHDSLHTLDHQSFEYNAVWPHLKEDGFLLSHDILHSSAFYAFSRKVGRKYLHINTFGVMKK